MNSQNNSANGVATATHGSPMPTMPTKTPVSLLQELCAKRGITPKYDLIQVEGAVHQPTFLYKATVGEFMATAQGQSKKKAKHAVAKAVLDLVLGTQGGAAPPGVPMAPMAVADSIAGQLVSPYEDGIAGNPVGQLQELCMAYRLPPPVYEPVSEQGLPHERTFTIACRIGAALCETGVGKSKKIAKRQASNLLLTKLRELPPPPPPCSNADGSDPNANSETADETAQRLAEHFATLRMTQIPTLTAPDSVQVGQFHRGLKASNGAKLMQLRETQSSPGAWNCLQFLQELAQEQNFKLTWIDVDEKSFDGRCQCLVQLSSLPVAVCYGVGSDSERARADAAHNALQYLKIMIK